LEVKNIRKLLKEYLLGNATDNDIKMVDNWYQSFENEVPVKLSAQEAAATKEEIWEKIAPSITVERKVWTMPRYMKVAAMLAVVAGAGLTFFLLNKKETAPTQIAYTTISTNIGERKTITTKDGSVLTLNAGSTIRIQDDFSKQRNIDIVDGEVFFDVKKDAERPFTITSGSLTTTVLGTAFNINAYKGINKIDIGVVSGKISVAKDANTLSVLEKSQGLEYNKTTQTFKAVAVDDNMLAWKEGRVVLNDISFDEMSLLMKKNFGINITTNDKSIRNTNYTTELFTTMKPEAAAEVLAAIHGLKIRKQDNQIFLYK
jgi:ferric-dicitrate binding protein FerR (iron transport regulator)